VRQNQDLIEISIAPINKSVFNPNDQIIFELPTSRKGTWLDQSQSYLKFSVQFASTTACGQGGSGIYLDNSAYSFLNRLDIFHGSNACEQISEYGQLCNFLMDTSLTQSDKAGLSTLIGTNHANISYTNVLTNSGVIAASGTSDISGQILTGNYRNFIGINAQVQTPGDRSGFSPASVALASGISTAVPYTFSLPLLNASKMLPVGKLTSPIRVELYLSANDNAIYYGTAGANAVWQITNVEFCACYVELNDDSLDQMALPGEEEYISTTTYRQSSTYLPSATSGEFTCLLPFRAASITGLYARFRPFGTSVQGSNASAAYRSASINPNLSFFYYRIGSSLYPNKPIYLNNGSLTGTGSEAYAELLKSFHALSSTIGNSALTYNNYNVAATADKGWFQAYVPGAKTYSLSTATAVGTVPSIDTFGNNFGIGLECQSFSNRNDTILSGISTLNSQIYFTGGLNNGMTAGGANNYNYTIDFFSQMDMVLIIKDGIMSARY